MHLWWSLFHWKICINSQILEAWIWERMRMTVQTSPHCRRHISKKILGDELPLLGEAFAEWCQAAWQNDTGHSLLFPIWQTLWILGISTAWLSSFALPAQLKWIMLVRGHGALWCPCNETWQPSPAVMMSIVIYRASTWLGLHRRGRILVAVCCFLWAWSWKHTVSCDSIMCAYAGCHGNHTLMCSPLSVSLDFICHQKCLCFGWSSWCMVVETAKVHLHSLLQAVFIASSQKVQSPSGWHGMPSAR